MSKLTLPLISQHLTGVAEALDRCGDTATVQDVLEGLNKEEFAAYGTDKGLLVIKWVEDERCVHFYIATGEMDEVIRLANEVMDWSRERGFEKASLIGRRGWVRALKTEGWEERSVYMEKAL